MLFCWNVRGWRDVDLHYWIGSGAFGVKFDTFQLLGLVKCIFEAGWPSLEEVTTDGVMEIGDKEGDGEVVGGASGSMFG